MLPITLVRHPINFYLVQAVGFLFACSIGIFICWTSAEAIITPGVKRSNYLILIVGLGLVYLAFHMVVKYFKNTPIITLNSFEITFDKRVSFKLRDIDELKLTGKVSFPMLFNFPMEGTSIRFKNGETKFIYDELYSNAWQLKSILEKVVVNKEPYEMGAPETKPTNTELEHMEVFKGNPYFSLRGIMLWGLIGYLMFLTFFGGKPIDPKVTMIFIGISIFWFLAISNSMNYFGLSDEYFIVKNHHFIWKRHLYKLIDIREIVFETQPKASNCLRIISRDFHTKLYPAGTLHDKHWLELMRRLEAKGVPVRNECIRPG